MDREKIKSLICYGCGRKIYPSAPKRVAKDRNDLNGFYVCIFCFEDPEELVYMKNKNKNKYNPFYTDTTLRE